MPRHPLAAQSRSNLGALQNLAGQPEADVAPARAAGDSARDATRRDALRGRAGAAWPSLPATAAEVAWLDLTDAALVVLSACETDLGRARSGAGLIGLRRAFHTAGAETVVSSLWSVEDVSTAELMRSFHENLWVAGMDRVDALRSAQLAMLRHNREELGDPLPATWGAFVLSGEWR